MDAYAAETSAIGNWAAIGYEAPGTMAANKSSSATNVIDYTSTAAGATWTATPKAALNECTTGMKWELTAAASATNVTISDASSQNCKDLTPNWSGLLRAAPSGT